MEAQQSKAKQSETEWSERKENMNDWIKATTEWKSGNGFQWGKCTKEILFCFRKYVCTSWCCSLIKWKRSWRGENEGKEKLHRLEKRNNQYTNAKEEKHKMKQIAFDAKRGKHFNNRMMRIGLNLVGVRLCAYYSHWLDGVWKPMCGFQYIFCTFYWLLSPSFFSARM